jgi:hypothetical protein
MIEKIYNEIKNYNIQDYSIKENKFLLHKSDNTTYDSQKLIKFFSYLYRENEGFTTLMDSLNPSEPEVIKPLINSDLINDDFLNYYLNIENENEILWFFTDNKVNLKTKGFEYDITMNRDKQNDDDKIFTFSKDNGNIYNNDELISEFKRLYHESDDFRFHLDIYLKMYDKKFQSGAGRKTTYKSTKKKVSVIIKKKTLVRTIYKNSRGVNYIKVNNEYKLLSKFKIS